MTSLYRIRVKSLRKPDGVESLVCGSCRDAARFTHSGPSFHFNGERFMDLSPRLDGVALPVAQGECPDCRQREALTAQHDRRGISA